MMSQKVKLQTIERKMEIKFLNKMNENSLVGFRDKNIIYAFSSFVIQIKLCVAFTV